MRHHEDVLEMKVDTSSGRLDLQQIAHALEDLPEDARQQAADIASAPGHVTLRRRIVDELENAALDAYGNLERVPLLAFLAQYPVTPYTYQVSPAMSRGERPSPAKLRDLFSRGQCRTTVNLCAEMPDGDDPVIRISGLAGQLRTLHIPVTDMLAPQRAQVIQLLDLLRGPDAQRAYVHCEAGQGRTGVMTACYRMAVLGWNSADALAEARNFGCSVPMQQAFILGFGAVLLAQDRARAVGLAAPDPALGSYPLLPAGSVRPAPRELTATIASVARAEAGEIE